MQSAGRTNELDKVICRGRFTPRKPLVLDEMVGKDAETEEQRRASLWSQLYNENGKGRIKRLVIRGSEKND